MSSSEENAREAADAPRFDPAEIRVLAVLAEKEALTPDAYPMSLNALTNGCNQLSSRDPVMTMTEDEVRAALQRLMERKFAAEVSQAGARVAKYEHRMRIKWALEQDKLAVLTILMLRGAQTAGEIRARSGRLHDFASVASVESALQFLADKYPPLVARLPRTPGTKEARYAALLSGEAVDEGAGETQDVRTAPARADRIAQLEAQVERLQAEVVELREQLHRFRQQFE